MARKRRALPNRMATTPQPSLRHKKMLDFRNMDGKTPEYVFHGTNEEVADLAERSGLEGIKGWRREAEERYRGGEEGSGLAWDTEGVWVTDQVGSALHYAINQEKSKDTPAILVLDPTKLPQPFHKGWGGVWTDNTGDWNESTEYVLDRIPPEAIVTVLYGDAYGISDAVLKRYDSTWVTAEDAGWR